MAGADLKLKQNLQNPKTAATEAPKPYNCSNRG